MKFPVLDYLAKVLPGLASVRIRRLPELTRATFATQSC